MNWRRLYLLLRIAVSGGLILFILWRANPASVWQSWRSADVRFVVLALVLQLVGVALSAAKWQILLRLNGHNIEYSWLLKTYLVGQFTNNVLPTTVGGDVVRTAQLSRRIGSLSAAGASTFIDRLTGFLALSLIANLALLWSTRSETLSLKSAPELQYLAIGGGVAAICTLVACFGAPWLLGLVPLGGMFARLRRPLEKIATNVAAYVPRGWALVPVLLLSLLFQSLWVVIHVVCGWALNIEAPLLVYALMVPLTDILGLAPIFINNLGVRDTVFALYLGQVGVPTAQAVALSFLIFTVRLVISLLGGLVLAFDRPASTTRWGQPSPAVYPVEAGDIREKP